MSQTKGTCRSNLHPLLQKFSVKQMLGWEKFQPSSLRQQLRLSDNLEASLATLTLALNHWFDLKTKLILQLC